MAVIAAPILNHAVPEVPETVFSAMLQVPTGFPSNSLFGLPAGKGNETLSAVPIVIDTPELPNDVVPEVTNRPAVSNAVAIVVNGVEAVGVCHVAAVPEVAVSTCPEVGAVAEDTFTVDVALARDCVMPEVSEVAVPVIFVPTSAEGVPRAGVTSVGDVPKTSSPDPVSSVTVAARFADDGVPRKVSIPVAGTVTESVPAPPLVVTRPFEVRFESVAMFWEVLTEKAPAVSVSPVPAVYTAPAYCGTFKVFPMNVAAPLLPVVVSVIGA